MLLLEIAAPALAARRAWVREMRQPFLRTENVEMALALSWGVVMTHVRTLLVLLVRALIAEAVHGPPASGTPSAGSMAPAEDRTVMFGADSGGTEDGRITAMQGLETQIDATATWGASGC